MFDLFGDGGEGGGEDGAPPAQQLPLGQVPEGQQQIMPQMFELTPRTTSSLPRGHNPIDQPAPRNLRTQIQYIQGYLDNPN